MGKFCRQTTRINPSLVFVAMRVMITANLTRPRGYVRLIKNGVERKGHAKVQPVMVQLDKHCVIE